VPSAIRPLVERRQRILPRGTLLRPRRSHPLGSNLCKLRGKCVRYIRPVLSIDATMETVDRVSEGGFVNFH
jgi:hypothetical protein